MNSLQTNLLQNIEDDLNLCLLPLALSTLFPSLAVSGYPRSYLPFPPVDLVCRGKIHTAWMYASPSIYYGRTKGRRNDR